MKLYSESELARIILNKESLYKIMSVDKGIYLPDIVYGGVLLGVVRKIYFYVLSDKIKVFQMEIPQTKEEIFLEILKMNPGLMGFDMESLPDKQWLLNVLYTLKHNHKFFYEPISELTREFPEG